MVLLKRHQLVSIVLAAWTICIVFSLLSSPADLLAQMLAWSRLLQTFSHLLFFIFVWDFFNRYQPDLKLFIYTLAFGSLVIMASFIIELSLSDLVEIETFFFQNPPFNSHMRHTGYQVTGVICFFLIFITQKTSPGVSLLNSLVLLFLFSFLFWLGGRGAMLSVFITTFLMIGLLQVKVIEGHSPFVFKLLLVMFFAFLLSELLTVYSWNGLINTYARSAVSDSINQLSTGRIEIWKSTVESLNGNWLFGLGPQGYYFMPNRLFGVQPHNVILQFLIEWGLIGTVLFSFLLIRGFLFGIRLQLWIPQQKISIYSLAAGMVIIGLSFHALFDGTYYHPQPTAFLAIAFAIWLRPGASGDQNAGNLKAPGIDKLS